MKKLLIDYVDLIKKKKIPKTKFIYEHMQNTHTHTHILCAAIRKGYV